MVELSENMTDTTPNNENVSTVAEKNDQVTASDDTAENQKELVVVSESNTCTHALSTNVEQNPEAGTVFIGKETSSNADGVDVMIESAGMKDMNRDLDIVTSWTTFPAPPLYDDEQDSETDVMVWQGPWFERRDLEGGGIVQQ